MDCHEWIAFDAEMVFLMWKYKLISIRLGSFFDIKGIFEIYIYIYIYIYPFHFPQSNFSGPVLDVYSSPFWFSAYFCFVNFPHDMESLLYSSYGFLEYLLASIRVVDSLFTYFYFSIGV